MFDAIGALLELFLTEGVPSPLTLQKQRQARLAMSGLALAASGAVVLWFYTSSVWSWSIAVVAAVVAGWVLLFSVVDVVKELPSIAWLSIAAAASASAALVVIGLWLL
jgi:hypothetical protein